MTAPSLPALVEAATGPDRELDAAIQRELGDGSPHHWFVDLHGQHVTDALAPAFTASIDAAMTLVPEDCVWSVGDWKAKAGPASASVWPPEDTRPEDYCGIVQAATPALALCAAALRARKSTPAEAGR